LIVKKHENLDAVVSLRTSKEVARISPDGILSFTVEASDENAAKFIENLIKRRLTGLDVTKKP